MNENNKYQPIFFNGNISSLKPMKLKKNS
jgi:hypothetical protein